MISPVEETGLIRSQSVEAVVAQYQAHEAKIIEAFRTIHESESAIVDLFGGSVWMEKSRIDFGRPEIAMDSLRRSVWRRIVDLAGIRRMLSIRAAEGVDKMLQHDKLPDITVEAVRGMIEKARDEAPEHIAEAVREVHGYFTPQSGRYKTNERFDVGERLVLDGWVTPGYRVGTFNASHYRSQYFRAVDNVFRLLDGKPPITTHGGGFADAVSQAAGGVGETEYFAFRCYRNGNLHLRMKRLDLLEKLNAIAGGNRLYAGESETKK